MSKQDVILVSINKSWNPNSTEEELYEATNYAWGISKDKVANNSINYAFAVYENRIIEVYKIKKWVPANERIPKKRNVNTEKAKKRFAFDGTIAKEIRNHFIGQKVEQPIGQLGFTYRDYAELEKKYVK